MTVSPVIAE